MIPRVIYVLWLGCCAAMFSAQALAQTSEKKVVTWGVYAYLGLDATLAEYQPIVDYLNAQLTQEHLELSILSMDALNDAIAHQQVDIITTNPNHFLQIRARYPEASGAIATAMRRYDQKLLSRLGGVIFTKSSRQDINYLQDLVGKRIVTPHIGHLGGYFAQLYELHRAGIVLSADHVIKADSYRDAVDAVMSGKADVGFVRTGMLEFLQQEGVLWAADTKVLNAQYVPNFPHKISTNLYPEWAVFAMPTLNESVVRRIASAMFGMSLTQSKDGRIEGYTIPADYSNVETLSRQLRLPPFDQESQFNLSDVWQRWSSQGIVLIALVLLLMSTIVGLMYVLKRAAQDRLRIQLLLSSLGDGVFGVDARGMCTFVNDVALNLVGFERHEVIGHNQHSIFHHHYADGRQFDADECPIMQTLKDGETKQMESCFIRKDGTLFPVHLTVAAMKHLDHIVGVEVVFHDISAQKEAEKQLFQLANYDSLTQCPNRNFFMQNLVQHFRHLQRFPHTSALLMLDLDHFKQINDRFGHAGGDTVLAAFAQCMRDMLPDNGLCGRMGGEEFTILLKNTNVTQAKQMAEQLRRAVSEICIHQGSQDIRVTVSIGVALSQESDGNVDAWLQRADAMMYHAKHLGRNRVEVQR